jgi:hypothetical protein
VSKHEVENRGQKNPAVDVPQGLCKAHPTPMEVQGARLPELTHEEQEDP